MLVFQKLCSRLFVALPLLVLFRTAQAAEPPSGRNRPNIILIVVDTLGAKHLGVYDPSAGRHPAIEELARGGVVFENTFSSSSWTKPAIASILTGVYPSKHGVRRLKGVLAPEQRTLAEILRELGYETHGIISHTLITSQFGYNQGFDTFSLVPLPEGTHRAISSPRVTAAALHELPQSSPRCPLFLLAHYFDVHFNYQDHKEFDLTSWYSGKLKPGMSFAKLRRRFPLLSPDDQRFVVSLYREEIAFVDKWIGALLAELRERRLLDNSLVIITADHGEEFGEHGSLGHTRTLYSELTRVPLLLYYPERLKPARISQPVSLVDIVPSILDLLNEKGFGPFDGVSFVPAAHGKALAPRTLFSEVEYQAGGIQAVKTAAIGSRFKVVKDHLANKIEAFDWKADPGELNSLPLERAGDEALELSRELDAHGASAAAAPETETQDTPEEVEALKSLGYL